MKKTILSLTLSALTFLCEAQTSIIMNSVGANTSGNFSMQMANGRRVGSIQIYTNSAFNGSTGTAALQGSNDGTNWATVYADDNVTALSFTLATGENHYAWVLKTIAFNQYRIVYTKGNASAGTVKAVLNAQ